MLLIKLDQLYELVDIKVRLVGLIFTGYTTIQVVKIDTKSIEINIAHTH